MSKFLEVMFKGNRLATYFNREECSLTVGDYVIVGVGDGEDLGSIHRLVDVVYGCGKTPPEYEVLRMASEEELNTLKENGLKEAAAKPIAKRLFKKHELDMKLSEVEYQFDRKKLTFFFTADERVDFRNLVKDLAKQFRLRIELRQINAREEARKLGGCGKCGLELCCTTCILHEFKPVSTQHAKDQFLTENPSKLTGMCGRLRCCLRYELEMYKDAAKLFPEMDSVIMTPAGKAKVAKIDILNKMVHLRFEDQSVEPLPLDDVQLLMAN